jgi:hypothetical protein
MDIIASTVTARIRIDMPPSGRDWPEPAIGSLIPHLMYGLCLELETGDYDSSGKRKQYISLKGRYIPDESNQIFALTSSMDFLPIELTDLIRCLRTQEQQIQTLKRDNKRLLELLKLDGVGLV